MSSSTAKGLMNTNLFKRRCQA